MPLELSPPSSQIPPHQLFPPMASEGEFPTSPQGPLEVSSTQIPRVGNDSKYNFPYVGSIPPPPLPQSSEPLFPPSYASLAQLVLGTPSAPSVYHSHIWSSGTMPTSSSFVSSVTSQIPVPTVVSSVPVQPTVMVGTVNVPIGSSSPPLSEQYVSPPIPPHGDLLHMYFLF